MRADISPAFVIESRQSRMRRMGSSSRGRRERRLGPAVELFPGEVYGKPLLDAYRLESQVAVYPRTIIGSELFRYLGYLEALAPDTEFNAYASGKARQCRELVCNAPDDGRKGG